MTRPAARFLTWGDTPALLTAASGPLHPWGAIQRCVRTAAVIARQAAAVSTGRLPAHRALRVTNQQ